MKYIIVDLEATCWEQRGVNPNEIIEIGAVCVDDQKRIVSEFNIFVKPTLHPVLSDFCTQLTSITQDEVDNAPLFPEALSQFREWIASFRDDYLLCSWGHYDKKQLIQDCRLHQLDTGWLDHHISLKHQYTAIAGARRHMGMKAALRKEGISLEGVHHRGIDDARNIANIFLRRFGEWKGA